MFSKEYTLWNEYGSTQKEKSIVLGPHSSYEWNHSRRRLLFSMARYKFAMKMIGSVYQPNEKKILELGCSDGFGTHYIAEFAEHVLGVDFDEQAISYAKSEKKDKNVEFKLDNFLDKKYGEFDGIVSFDVIEHIYPEHEENYMKTVMMNLSNLGGYLS